MDSDGNPQRARKKRKPRKPRKPMDAERLERAAFHYLERFSASEAHFRTVLANRIRRSQSSFDLSEEQMGWIEAITAKASRVGALDDARYAEVRAGGLLRRGKPINRIRADLFSKGLSGEVVDAAIEALADESPMPDLSAAMTYARRRRFGPWRRVGGEGRREKEIAAMARAGFHFELAKRIIDAPDPAALEDELEYGRETP